MSLVYYRRPTTRYPVPGPVPSLIFPSLTLSGRVPLCS